MKRLFFFLWFIWIILASAIVDVHAADTVIRGVNLGSCSHYSDGCNECTIGENGQAACTKRACFWEGVPSCLDPVTGSGNTDTQIVDLEAAKKSELKTDFSLQTFSSCENMESKLKKFLESYYTYHPGGSYRGGIMPMMEDAAVWALPPGAMSSDAKTSAMPTSAGTVTQDFSTTNIQVAGVDESEIVKTDGRYVYFYNTKDHLVYITDASNKSNPVIIKKIKIPEAFVNPELFLSGKKLTVLATKYDNRDYGYRYWFNRQVKTVVVVYDVSDVANLRIDRYYETIGNAGQSRMIGDYLYVLSSSSFAFPYEVYYGPLTKSSMPMLDSAKFNTDFTSSKLIPSKAELRKSDVASEQNFSLKGKKLPYNLSSKSTASCTDIEYLLPDDETMKSYDFNPNVTTLSIVNLKNPTEETKTKVLFGDVAEIHMSQKSLYITSHLSSTRDFKCGPGMMCILPWYPSGQNTLIHKMSVSGNTVKYVDSTIVPGSPINQYSMDEDASGNFRIVTRNFAEKPSTSLFVLDASLNKLGSITDIAPGETFQSARFIGERLYLVTFEQIDPLFTIDLSDARNPKILGELKIPGYSTYLHPYDATHLIGLGYSTKTNQWGGTQNAGLKIDLYDVGDIKNPRQLHTLTLGDMGSYSDVLSNPRLFVWDAKRHLLMMSATLMTSANDPKEPYRNKDAWQGSIVTKIDTDAGIREVARVTHIDRGDLEAKRKKDCAPYANVTIDTTPVCRELIGGGKYCSAPTQTYVPPYCYADSTTGEYFASQMWNYSNDFILRNLYLDSRFITISNSRLQISDMDNGYVKTGSVEMK